MSDHEPDPGVDALLCAVEHEDCEFKKAASDFSTERLQDYASGLSNMDGGRLVLGVSNQRPRVATGTGAFSNDLERRARDLQRQIHVPVRPEERFHLGKRVVIFHIAKHRLGVPTPNGRGGAKMRVNEELVDLTEQRRREIWSENAEDFSARICPGLTVQGLIPDAIELYRTRWVDRLAKSESRRDRRASARRSTLAHRDLLQEAELLTPEGLTYAALLLFGTRGSLTTHLANAEVIFEYRAGKSAGPAAARWNLREGFLNCFDDLWDRINQRNDLQSVQQKLFRDPIPTFQEEPIREVILNAVAHRDYTHQGSILIRQYPRELTCQSPGGLPRGVTLENIAGGSVPRNRRLMEALESCGLVERSGQGIDLMLESSVLDTKPLPDFTGTDADNVIVTLGGTIASPAYVGALRQIAREHGEQLSTDHYRVLHHVSRQERVPPALRADATQLRDLGVLESTGAGNAVRFILGRNLRKLTGDLSHYTREHGLDREQNVQLLLKHLHHCGEEGAQIGDLQKVIPALSRSQIKDRVQTLAERGVARLGTRDGRLTRGRSARWFAAEPAPGPG